MKATPSTPMRSPRSRPSRVSIASAPRTSARACSWMRPLRSTRSRNAILPWPRRAARRPATRWRTSVSSPASRASWVARTSAIGSTPGYACGNGSTPSARRRSSFSRRTASSSSAIPGPLEADFDGGDAQLARTAAGQRDLDDVVALAADEGAADGRLVRQALRRLGLGRADDRERLVLAALLVGDLHDGADLDDVRRQVLCVDDRRRAQLLLDGGDALLEHGLLVLRVVVLGVLRDVAERASLLDPLGDFAPPVRLQVDELELELLEAFRGEDDVLGHRPNRPTAGWERGSVTAPLGPSPRVRRPPRRGGAGCGGPRAPRRATRFAGARRSARDPPPAGRRTRGRTCAGS